MKRIIAFLLSIILVMSISAAVMAAGNGNGQGKSISQQISNKAVSQSQVKADNKTKAQERVAQLAEIRALTQQLKTNNTQIRELRNKLKADIDKLRITLRALKANTSALTQEQIDEITNIMAEIKKQRLEFGTNHINKINIKLPALRTAKKGNDLTALKAAYSEIFAEQQKRISDLKDLIANIETTLSKYNDLSSKIAASASAASVSTSITASAEGAASSTVVESKAE